MVQITKPSAYAPRERVGSGARNPAWSESAQKHSARKSRGEGFSATRQPPQLLGGEPRKALTPHPAAPLTARQRLALGDARSAATLSRRARAFSAASSRSIRCPHMRLIVVHDG